MSSGRSPDAIDLDAARTSAASLPQFAAVSAVDQAVSDLSAQHAGVALSTWLGSARRASVDAYANINRSVSARTPQGFAERARDAVAAGFRAVKLAPFDEVTLYGDAMSAPAAGLDAGLARIAAVRDAVGASVDVMVDCHWRLNETAARTVLRECEPLALHWLECPVPESPEMVPTIVRLRAFANARGVRLAGCEEMSLVGGFAPYLAAGALDVLMPDVKYAGGLREMLRVAEAIGRAGAAFSPHNPNKPGEPCGELARVRDRRRARPPRDPVRRDAAVRQAGRRCVAGGARRPFRRSARTGTRRAARPGGDA